MEWIAVAIIFICVTSWMIIDRYYEYKEKELKNK